MQSISTILGDLPLSSLEFREETKDEEEATLRISEYWYEGQCVKRDVIATLKPKSIYNITMGGN